MKLRFFLAGTVAIALLSGCTDKADQKPGSTTAASSNVTITQASPPPGGSWADVVNETSAGYLMGNPQAPVKLVEIASLGCPFCKKFEDEGVPSLKEYVKSGKLSWEFRPYLIHGPVDMAATLIAKCNGAKTFFPITEAMYKDQAVWMGKLESAPPEQLQQIQNLPPTQVFVAIASLVGLQDWAAARGLPPAKSNQCLADQGRIDREVQNTTDVNSQFPDFKGTPSFVLNGSLLADTSSWDKLKPQLEAALK